MFNTVSRPDGIIYMTAPNISAVHAFTTRHGGVSRGVYESLNLGLNTGDDSDKVRENYKRICRELDITDESLICSRQVHGVNIRTVTRDDCGGLYDREPYEADGLITDDPEAALMVFTADCVPILLYDPVRRAVGAVHAGWRGTAADIIGTAAARLVSDFGCFARDIRAAIGPCISKCCFETDGEVPDALRTAIGSGAENCIVRRDDKFLVDLKEANRLLLLRAGVENILISDECTSCKCTKYWSHRRTNGVRGSQAAIITLKGTE